MVFRQFLELVQASFGEDTADDIIEAAELASGGAYTAVGTYAHQEMIQLVGALSEKVEIPARDLLHVFAEHLMAYFAEQHPRFFEEAGDLFGFIESIERHVHVEVRKLYPDAQLPSFECRRSGEAQLELIYRSERPFSELAHGLVVAAADRYREPVEVERAGETGDGGVIFRVRRRAAG